MMAPKEIREASDRAAMRAAQDNLEPYVYYDEGSIGDGPFPFPFLGDYVPKGWKLAETLFCDSSGFGRSDEASLTTEQLIEKLLSHSRESKDYGYGLTQVGQFQVYLGVFEKTKKTRGG